MSWSERFKKYYWLVPFLIGATIFGAGIFEFINSKAHPEKVMTPGMDTNLMLMGVAIMCLAVPGAYKAGIDA